MWGLTAALIVLLGLVLQFNVLAPSFQHNLLANLIGPPLLDGFFLLTPISFAMAILRSRLWDIDIVIRRSQVYGLLLTVSLVGLYTLIVIGVGRLPRAGHDLPLSLIAVISAPLRDRLQLRVNRRLYGERDTPYAVIARLGRRLEGVLAPKRFCRPWLKPWPPH